MLLVGNGRERVVGLEFGEMEEKELEEGEALSSGEAGIDPDVDFPYIDEKLEEVLGDIREGGVFDENMGARFNGYGSFLPLYQRTPSFHSQTKTPPKESTRNGIRSPFKPQHEVARISPSSQTRMTVTKSNNKIVLGSQSLPKSGEKEEKASAFNGTESCHENKSSDGRDNNVDHKRLKVRIKVGSDNTTKRDNAAIYSGLGLVISPSSSPENNHDEHEASSPEFGGMSNETPRTILQIMTCCPIPEEHILSPLHYSLLGLTEKGNAYCNEIKARLAQKSVSEASTNFARHVKDVEESEAKIIKMAENNRRSVEVRKLHSEDDTTMIKKDIHIDAPEEVVSNELNTLSSAGSTGVEERNKSPKNADLSRSKCIDNAAIVSKRSSTTNNVETLWSKEANAIANAEDQTRTSMVEEKLEDRRMSNRITESYSFLCEDSGHAMEADDFGKTSWEGHKTKNSNSIKRPKASKHKHDKRAASFVHAEERTVHEDDQLLEATKRSKGSTGLPTDCFTGEVAAPVHMSSLTKGKGSPTRSDYSGKRRKSKKRHNERNRKLGEEPYNMVEGARAEQVDDKLTLLNTSHKYNLTDVKCENEKSNHEGVKKSESSILAEQPMQFPAINDVPPDGGFTSNDQDPLDNWVQCDRCQKWRLLPSGTSTESLPSKWHCKMLNWLPGMNTCSISEDETSKALYALYSRPVPDSGTILNGHPNVAASIVTSVDGGHSYRNNESELQNGPRIGKKKKHAASLPSRSTPIQSFAVKNEEISMNTGKVDSLSQASQELTTLNKVDIEGSKSLKVSSEEAAHKQLKQQADKGDFLKESGKTLTSKSKRRVDGDGTLLFKKMKVAESCNSDSDAHGKLVLSTDDHLPAKLSHTNVQKNCSSSKYLMSKLQDDNPSSKKSIHQAFCGRELKENFDGTDIKNCDELSLKKRKMKQKDSRQGSIGEHVNFKEDVRDSGSRKEKKAKLLKPDGKSRSTADNRVNKVGRAAASEVHNKKVVGRNVDDGKLHKIAHQDNASHQHGDHDIISSKRGIGNGRPSAMGPESNNCTYLGSNEEAVACKSVNSSSQGALDAIEKSEIVPVRRSQALPSTSDSQQLTTSTVKESRSTVNHFDAANGVRLDVSKDPKTIDAQNAGASTSSRHTGPSDTKAVAGTPFRKDFHPANAIFKEARELKHMANRIKTDGPELESTTMYFQAALKYLHGASLLELDGDRHGELTQSLKMYSDTAKLLEFCAHEYEKRKEMAAAALAYKCMEVAYFKIAYYRHPVANKDRQEWQATVSMHSLGESPSSSVSDLDNLYNGCLVDKSAALVKGANSPQAAGNRAIAARSSNLVRLLDYMNETMFAFEASRKSHNAIAAANARLDKYGNDGLASVRTVLDLSFHNVQELLRLVRLSIESIHL